MSCDPQTLAVASRCFQCVPEGKKLDVLIYLFAALAGVTTDPETLLVASKCFACIPEGKKMDVLLYIACNITGGGGGSIQVYSYSGADANTAGLVPSNPAQDAIAYSIDGTGPTMGWNKVSTTWT